MRYIKSFNNDAAIQAAVDDKSLGKPYVAFNKQTGLIDWNVKEPDYSKMYLTIEALSGGTFYVRKANFGYSVNGGAWETTTGVTTLALNQGDAVRFKGNGTCRELFSGNTLAFNAYGNIESLEYGDDFIGQTSIITNDKAFYAMFQNCSKLMSVNNLILPATNFQVGSYNSIFMGCTSIVKAPELPATILKNTSYTHMFDGCASLNYVKCLATDLTGRNCTLSWLDGVSPTGTFVKKAGVTWPTGTSGIPSGWTVIEE